MANCEIKLAASRERSGVLSLFMKPLDGVLLSNFIRMLPLMDLRHFVVHSSFSLAAWLCFRADGFISKGRRRYMGRASLSEDDPFAAFLASSSAFSLPLIPSCPAVHLFVILNRLLPFLFWILL